MTTETEQATVITLSQKDYEKKLVAEAKARAETEYQEYLKNSESLLMSWH